MGDHRRDLSRRYQREFVLEGAGHGDPFAALELRLDPQPLQTLQTLPIVFSRMRG
jgi:hypothetical protein